MPAKIAVIADIHLSDVPGTAQEAALAHALNCLRAENPDLLLVLGDVTNCGTLSSAERVRGILEKSGLCFRMIPGNSDERSLTHRSAVLDLLTVNSPFYGDGYAVCLLDICDGKPGFRGLDSLNKVIEEAGDRRIILGSHYPLEEFVEFPGLRKVIDSGRISLFLGAHLHYEDEAQSGDMSVHIVRALDPDKSIGAPPSTTLFKLIDDQWQSSHIAFEDGTVSAWSSSMHQEFTQLLGFSCMSATLEGLSAAVMHSVRCVELRAPHALSVGREELLEAIRRWRDSGGTTLSMHMPDLECDNEYSAIIGIETFREAVSLAFELKVDYMTLHVPRAPVSLMQPGSEIWSRFTDAFVELINEPLVRGTGIGVENLHMNPGESHDDSRGFGYLPDECLNWVESLRRASGSERIGFHLDVGHARNNYPFSKKISVSQWYALTGKEIVGYHLHQVSPEMKNHIKITDVYGPMISFSSFFWAWKSNVLAHAPIYLEIRSDNFKDTIDSLKCLRGG